MIPAMARSVAAFDLGGTKVAAGLVTSGGKIRKRLVEPVAKENALDQMVRMAGELGDFDAAGVAVPGLVRRDGTVWAPNLPGWDRVPLARLLKRRLGVPLFVESDRNAAALGEAWRGAARGKSDVIVLIVGTGIGAGILSGGCLLRGAHELSGCAGWMVVTEETNAMTRKSGSLEALAAGPAIARHSDYARAGRLLGYAVANLISLFDPEVVVLTGGVTNAAEKFLDDLRWAVNERAHPLSAPQVEIRVSTLQGDANLLGAARLALQGGIP
jgi:glucokinase